MIILYIIKLVGLNCSFLNPFSYNLCIRTNASSLCFYTNFIFVTKNSLIILLPNHHSFFFVLPFFLYHPQTVKQEDRTRPYLAITETSTQFGTLLTRSPKSCGLTILSGELSRFDSLEKLHQRVLSCYLNKSACVRMSNIETW